MAVNALPFQSFAFASTLAGIHYDGYVDTTQDQINSTLVKHVLDNFLVEVCISQSLSGYVDARQNHRRPLESVPGEIVEALQVEVAAYVPELTTVD